MPANELCYMRAIDLAGMIRDGDVSAREVMEAHIDQIDRVNPQVNAIVTYHPDVALETAKAADDAAARGGSLGPLHGLPIAHKDLTDTAGVRTTSGSPLFRDNVPDVDALIIERLKGAGAISVGKTNVPEFGAGSQTFNPVFGPTLNPYDLTKTCGGSSGGAAVALACGMLPIADGSDMGGSLRNPGNYNNVVGFRTSPGRVPVWPTSTAWSPFSVAGPMARTVEDAALMLSAIAGPDPRSPISIEEPGKLFARPLERDLCGIKVAFSPDLDGSFPVDPRVRSVIESRRGTFADLGCQVHDEAPDMTDADTCFKAWRAWQFELGRGELVDAHRDQIKDTVIWNVEEGRRLTGPELGEAEKKRTALYHRVREFMQEYEFLVLCVNQVPPFDVQQPYVTEIDGVAMTTYIDWMKSCYYVSIIGHPAISVPCGFTQEGLPVGIQIVGRHHDDWGVLQMAYAFQQATEMWKHRPAIAK